MTSVVKSDYIRKCPENQNDALKERKSTLPILKERKVLHSSKTQENNKRLTRLVVAEPKHKDGKKANENDIIGNEEKHIVVSDSKPEISQEHCDNEVSSAIKNDKKQITANDDIQLKCTQSVQNDTAKPAKSTNIKRSRTLQKPKVPLHPETKISSVTKKENITCPQKQSFSKIDIKGNAAKDGGRKAPLPRCTPSSVRSSKSRSATPPSMSSSTSSTSSNGDKTKRQFKTEFGHDLKKTGIHVNENKTKAALNADISAANETKSRDENCPLVDTSRVKRKQTIPEGIPKTKLTNTYQTPIHKTVYNQNNIATLQKGNKIASSKRYSAERNIQLQATKNLGRNASISSISSASSRDSKSRSASPPSVLSSTSLTCNGVDKTEQIKAHVQQIQTDKNAAMADANEKHLVEFQENENKIKCDGIQQKSLDFPEIKCSENTLKDQSKTKQLRQYKQTEKNSAYKPKAKSSVGLSKDSTIANLKQNTAKSNIQCAPTKGFVRKVSVSAAQRSSKSRSTTPPSMSSSSSSTSSKSCNKTKHYSKSELIEKGNEGDFTKNKITKVKTETKIVDTFSKLDVRCSRSRSKTPGSSSASSDGNHSIESTSSTDSVRSNPQNKTKQKKELPSTSKLSQRRVKAHETMSYMKTTQSAINKNFKLSKTNELSKPIDSRNSVCSIQSKSISSTPDNSVNSCRNEVTDGSAKYSTRESKQILTSHANGVISTNNTTTKPRDVIIANETISSHIESTGVGNKTKTSSFKSVSSKKPLNQNPKQSSITSVSSASSVPENNVSSNNGAKIKPQRMAITIIKSNNFVSTEGKHSKLMMTKPIKHSNSEPPSSVGNNHKPGSKQSILGCKAGGSLSRDNTKQDVLSNKSSTLSVMRAAEDKNCIQSQCLSKSNATVKQDHNSRLIAPLAGNDTDCVLKVSKTNPRSTPHKSEKVSKLKPRKNGLIRSEFTSSAPKTRKPSSHLKKNSDNQKEEKQLSLTETGIEIFDINDIINGCNSDTRDQESHTCDTSIMENDNVLSDTHLKQERHDCDTKVELSPRSEGLNVNTHYSVEIEDILITEEECTSRDTLQHHLGENRQSTDAEISKLPHGINLYSNFSTETVHDTTYIGSLNEDICVSMETNSAAAIICNDRQINDHRCSVSSSINSEGNINCISIHKTNASDEYGQLIPENYIASLQDGNSCETQHLISQNCNSPSDEIVPAFKTDNSSALLSSTSKYDTASLHQHEHSSASNSVMSDLIVIDLGKKNDNQDTVSVLTNKEIIESERDQCAPHIVLQTSVLQHNLNSSLDRVRNTTQIGENDACSCGQNIMGVCQHCNEDVSLSSNNTLKTQIDTGKVNTPNYKNVVICQNDNPRICGDILMNEFHGLDSNSLRKLPNDKGCVSKQINAGIDKTECSLVCNTDAADTQIQDKRQNETELSTFKSVLCEDETFDCGMTQAACYYSITVHEDERRNTNDNCQNMTEVKMPRDLESKQKELSVIKTMNQNGELANNDEDKCEEPVVQGTFTFEKSELSDWQGSVILDTTNSENNEKTQQVLRFETNKTSTVPQICTDMNASSLLEHIRCEADYNNERKLLNESDIINKDTDMRPTQYMVHGNTIESMQAIKSDDTNNKCSIMNTIDKERNDNRNIYQVDSDIRIINTNVPEQQDTSSKCSSKYISRQNHHVNDFQSTEKQTDLHFSGTKYVKLINKENEESLQSECVGECLTQISDILDPTCSENNIHELVPCKRETLDINYTKRDSLTNDSEIAKNESLVLEPTTLKDVNEYSRAGRFCKHGELIQVTDFDPFFLGQGRTNVSQNDNNPFMCCQTSCERTASFMLADSAIDEEIKRFVTDVCMYDADQTDSTSHSVKSGDIPCLPEQDKEIENCSLKVNAVSQNSPNSESNNYSNLTLESQILTESGDMEINNVTAYTIPHTEHDSTCLPSTCEQTQCDTTNLIHVSTLHEQAINCRDDSQRACTDGADAQHFSISALSCESPLNYQEVTPRNDITQCDGTSQIKNDSDDSINQKDALNHHQINDLSLDRDVHTGNPDHLNPARDPTRDFRASPDMCLIYTRASTSDGNHKKHNLNTNQDLFEDQMSSLSTLNITPQKSSYNQAISEDSSQPGDFMLGNVEHKKCEGYEKHLTCADQVDTCNSSVEGGKNSKIYESEQDAKINSKKGISVASDVYLCCSKTQSGFVQEDTCVINTFQKVPDNSNSGDGIKCGHLENRNEDNGEESVLENSKATTCCEHKEFNCVKGANDDISVHVKCSPLCSFYSQTNSLYKACGLDTDSRVISSKTDTFLKDNLITFETYDNAADDGCTDTLIGASEVSAAVEYVPNELSNSGNKLVINVNDSSHAKTQNFTDLCTNKDTDSKLDISLFSGNKKYEDNNTSALLDNKDSIYHQTINSAVCCDATLSTKTGREKFVKKCDSGKLHQREVLPVEENNYEIDTYELKTVCRSSIPGEEFQSSKTRSNSIFTNAGEALCDNASLSDVGDSYDDICDNFVDAEETIHSDSEFGIDATSSSTGLCTIQKSGNTSLYSSGDVYTSVESFQDAVETLDDDYLTNVSIKKSDVKFNNEDDLSQISLPLSDTSSDADTSLENLVGWEEFADDIEYDEDMELPRSRGIAIQSNTVSSLSTKHVHTSQYRTASVLKDNQHLQTAPSASYTDRQSEIKINVLRSTDIKYESGQQAIKNVIFKTGDGKVPEKHHVQSGSGETDTSPDSESKPFIGSPDNSDSKPEDRYDTSYQVNESQHLAKGRITSQSIAQQQFGVFVSEDQLSENTVKDGELCSTSWCNEENNSSLSTSLNQQENRQGNTIMPIQQLSTSTSTSCIKTSTDTNVTSQVTSSVGLKIETAMNIRTERRRRRLVQKQININSSANSCDLNETCLNNEQSDNMKVCANRDSQDNVVIYDNFGTTSENSSPISKGSHTVTSINDTESVYNHITGESNISNLNESNSEMCTTDNVLESSGSVSLLPSKEKEVTKGMSLNDARRSDGTLDKDADIDNACQHFEITASNDTYDDSSISVAIRFNQLEENLETENIVSATEKGSHTDDEQTYTFSFQPSLTSTENDIDDIEFIDADDVSGVTYDVSEQEVKHMSPLEDNKSVDDKCTLSPSASFVVTFEIPSDDESSSQTIEISDSAACDKSDIIESNEIILTANEGSTDIHGDLHFENITCKTSEINVTSGNISQECRPIQGDMLTEERGSGISDRLCETPIHIANSIAPTDILSSKAEEENKDKDYTSFGNSQCDLMKTQSVEYKQCNASPASYSAESFQRKRQISETVVEGLNENMNPEIIEESNISVARALQVEKQKLNTVSEEFSDLRKQGWVSQKGIRRISIDTCKENNDNVEMDTDLAAVNLDLSFLPARKGVKKSKSFRIDRENVYSPDDNDNSHNTETANLINKTVSDICRSFLTKTRSAARVTKEKEQIVSPTPHRKLMKWVNDNGKWLRIPVNQISKSSEESNTNVNTQETETTETVQLSNSITSVPIVEQMDSYCVPDKHIIDKCESLIAHESYKQNEALHENEEMHSTNNLNSECSNIATLEYMDKESRGNIDPGQNEIQKTGKCRTYSEASTDDCEETNAAVPEPSKTENTPKSKARSIDCFKHAEQSSKWNEDSENETIDIQVPIIIRDSENNTNAETKNQVTSDCSALIEILHISESNTTSQINTDPDFKKENENHSNVTEIAMEGTPIISDDEHHINKTTNNRKDTIPVSNADMTQTCIEENKPDVLIHENEGSYPENDIVTIDVNLQDVNENKTVKSTCIKEQNEHTGGELEISDNISVTQLKRQEFLFGLRDNYNRRKPRKLIPGGKVPEQDKLKSNEIKSIPLPTTNNSEDIRYRDIIRPDNVSNNTTDMPRSIPKLKAVKIQEELFEGRPEYMKECNKHPLGFDEESLTHTKDMKHGTSEREFSSSLPLTSDDIENRECKNKEFMTIPKSPLKKSKTFDGLKEIEKYNQDKRANFSIGGYVNLSKSNASINEHNQESRNDKEKVECHSKEGSMMHAHDNQTIGKDQSEHTKIKRGHHQVVIPRYKSTPELGINKDTELNQNSDGTDRMNRPNELQRTNPNTTRPDKKRLKLPIIARIDRPKALQRNQLLSEIAEVEESKDEIPQTYNKQHSSPVNRQEQKYRQPGRRGNKRRSLSLPTGTLAFGDARIVYKNGHFTIETMDGSEIDSSRPPDDRHGSQCEVNSMHVTSVTFPGEGNKLRSREVTSLKNDSREDTHNSHKPLMKRQCGRTVLNKNDSVVENGEVFYNDVNNIENISPNSNFSVQSGKRVPKAGYTSPDGLNESNSSRTSETSFESSPSETMDVDTDVESQSGKDLVHQSNSTSSLPETSDPEIKQVAQRARRTSSFRQAQEAGALRLTGIEEVKDQEGTRRRTASLDESQNSDLNTSPLPQNSNNSTFFQKMMAKKKSLNENLNISTFTKQSESAKEFFAKKMTLKGLFKKNKSDSSVSSPMKTQHPVSPPIAAFQGDDDIGSVDTPPSSPYANREFRRRHTSADVYIKSFTDAYETDSNCTTPTQERSNFVKHSSSSPSTPSHETNSIVSFNSSCATSVRDEDQMSITSTSSATSSVHSVQSPPLEQPHKPKTPKPVGASPRRNPSFGSQMSRTSSLSRTSQRNRSVTSLESEHYDDSSQEYICECGHRVQTSFHQRKSSEAKGSSDSLTLCHICKNSLDCSDSAVFTSSDLVRKYSLVDRQNSSEDSPKHRKDSTKRTSYEKLGIVSQTDVVSSNSNDSGIQRDVSVHSSNESIKGTPEAPVKLRRKKSTSPQPERPKSEVGVRWADLGTDEYDLEDTPVRLRQRDQNHRDRPRPKSDLEDNIQLFDELFEEVLEDFETEGSSFLSHRMKAFGSEINLQPYCSLRNLYEMRRRDLDKQNKNRRMSTPHPIKSRMQRTPRKLQKQPPLVRSSSMPESLEKIHKRRKLHHLLDFHLDSLSRHMDMDDSMSDDSDLSFDHISLQEKSLSVQSSRSQLTSMDEEEDNLTYAEALWDHITMDPEELGFRAQDVIEVVDMSDKDWWFGVIEDREGWFPAAFVRLRVNQDNLDEELDLDVTLQESLTTSPKLRRISMFNKNQARTNVVNEIINAEREYVKHLKDVVEGYIQHARKRKEMFSEERIALIFGNIETIFTSACKFLAQLETCIDVCPHLSEIGQCFLDNEREYEIYSDYCNNHPSACEELKELCQDSKYKHFFEACRLLQELVEIPLEGFLLTPVQKICKYPLQLAELLKYTPPDHPDYEKVRDALSAMRKIATLINERKRKMESIEKIAAWQHSVVDWEDEDLLERSSELIFSGELNKINTAGWSQERYLFLFDHQLIYCKKELLKRHVFSYKGRIDLDHCEVIDVPDGKDLQYNVTVKHAFKLHETHRDKWYLVYGKTAAVKDRWLKALQDERKRVLEDQANDFCVPDHWKQTVLNKVRSQSNLKDKHQTSRGIHSTHLFQKDLKDFTYSTLPRRRNNSQKQDKKKGWSLFGGGKKSKR